MRELFYIAKCCHQTIHIVCSCFGLRSASGKSGAQTERRQERAGAQRRRRAADGSPPLMRHLRMLARDERAVLRSGTGVVERDTGDGQPVERSKPRVGHGDQTG